jgi:hypothetical protein
MSDKCGECAVDLVPRWGWYFACVLDREHDGPCRTGGTCKAHGPYVSNAGEHGCPQWPQCIKDIIAMENTEHV